MGKETERRSVKREAEVKGTERGAKGCEEKRVLEEVSERSQKVCRRPEEEEKEVERAIEEMLNECQREAEESRRRAEAITLGVCLEGRKGHWTCRAGEGRMEVPPRQREGVSNPQAWAVDSAVFLLEAIFIAVQGRERSSPSLHGSPLRDWL